MISQGTSWHTQTVWKEGETRKGVTCEGGGIEELKRACRREVEVEGGEGGGG